MNSLLWRSSANPPADPLMISAIDITAIVAGGTRSWPDLSMRMTETGHTRAAISRTVQGASAGE